MSNKVADWGIILQGSKHLPLWWNQRGEEDFPSPLRPLGEGRALRLTLLLFCCSSSVFPASQSRVGRRNVHWERSVLGLCY